MSDLVISESMPVLALRGLTVFPGMMSHFDVGREKSVQAMEASTQANHRIFLVTQKDIRVDDPGWEDLYEIGTVAKIKQILKMPNDSIRILVQGECRGKIEEASQTEPFLYGRVQTVEPPAYNAKSTRLEAMIRQSFQLLEELMELTQRQMPEQLMRVMTEQDPAFTADVIGQNGTFNYEEKMKILALLHPVRRLALANKLLARELEVLRMEGDLNEKVQESMNKNQRDYYLREQIKTIRTELGEEDEEAELDDYEEKIRALALPEESEKKLLKELGRLRKQPAGSSEAAVLRNYLDVCLDLPWNITTKERVDVKMARRILNEDHFGMQQVKERILETIAVKKLAPELPPQILCLVGPPGVGKTSIAFSIARCLNRRMARIALGGIHDEAEIRGHRKTYIGAMPGRIISGIQQAGSRNPLLLLDEIDKLSSDYRGDPASALLEVLDSEQNTTFRDNFLELPFDLSGCMFIITANTTDTIPRALLDRVEVIQLSSYTDEEKVMIAKRHLLPKQMKKHGITRKQLRVTDGALRETIGCYTRESGVRNLERELSTICRKSAMRLLEEDKQITVSGKNLEDFLGPRKILPDKLPPADPVGLVTGLAWTAVGGETLEAEVNVMDGTGKLELTGNLGDVMKESAHAAMSYIRAHAAELCIPADFYKTKDIHVHFPEGAVPKDGPSAGVTICTAMVSALSGATVRRDLAMTGEISIRGRVLPIGGLKEKTMAALRHGIKTVVIPKDNEKDLEEIDQTVRKALTFIAVEQVDAVLAAALDFSHCQCTVPLLEQQEKKLAMPVKKPDGSEKTGLRQ